MTLTALAPQGTLEQRIIFEQWQTLKEIFGVLSDMKNAQRPNFTQPMLVNPTP
jgi:hypothetical protein